MKSPDVPRNWAPLKKPYKMIKYVDLSDGSWLVLVKFRKKQYYIYRMKRHYYDDMKPNDPDFDPSHLNPVYMNKKLERAECAFVRIQMRDFIS